MQSLQLEQLKFPQHKLAILFATIFEFYFLLFVFYEILSVNAKKINNVICKIIDPLYPR